MSSDARAYSHRPVTSSLSAARWRHRYWVAPSLALALVGAACSMPTSDAPRRDPVAASVPESGGAGVTESAGDTSVWLAPSDPAHGAVAGVDAPDKGVADADGRESGLPAPAAGAADREAGPLAHAPETGLGGVTVDGAAPVAPALPGRGVVGVPPVVVPPVPVPPGLIQGGPSPACEPLPGARAGSWREPLPPTPRYNPEGPKRVGLQAGHWLTEQVPAELRGLQHGATGGGKMEWEVNLDVARRTKALLEAQGVAADILPTTVPIRYRAHLFVSIHADGDTTGRTRGFKIARPAFSSLPAVDDRLVGALYEAYGAATGLRRDDEHITPRMRYYYAFNARRFCHAVAPGVPQAIVEMGFLTNGADRQLLLGNPDVVARGIADGILRFLRDNP